MFTELLSRNGLHNPAVLLLRVAVSAAQQVLAWGKYATYLFNIQAIVTEL
jgi:hypothetical protein